MGKGKGREVSERLHEAAGPCPQSDRNFHWAVEMPQQFPPGFSQCLQSSRMAELMRCRASGRSQDLGSLGEELKVPCSIKHHYMQMQVISWKCM